MPGELIVRFEPGANASERSAARRRAHVRVKRALRLPGAQLVEVEEGTRANDAMRALEREGSVRYAEPNRIRRASATPNDTLFGRLWGLHNPSGLFTGTADADIDAPEGWDRSTGSSDVVVAVVDTGVAYDHPDLAARMIPGLDFFDNDADPRDPEGHGTHVAGTLGATGNNGTGVTGVSWRPTIMPLRALGPSGGTDDQIGDAFDYAGDNGARVVNASLSGPGFSSTLDQVIAAHPDTLYVVAAGNGGNDGVGDNNDGGTGDEYPCKLARPNLICVAATDSSDQLANFSNYGSTSVDLGAPGVNVLSAAIYSQPFYDGFEELNLNTNWVTSWTRQEDQFGGYVRTPGVTGSLELASAANLTGESGCSLGFFMFRELGAGDSLTVEKLVNGGSWTQVESYVGDTPGNTFVFDEVPLAADGQSSVKFAFRLTAAGNSAGELVALDDIEIACDGFGSSPYVFNSGTSMATPHVAGAAAVLWSAQPGATVQQVKSALLDGGKPLADLQGTTFSGRRLNLAGALATLDAAVAPAPAPPPPEPAPAPAPTTTPPPPPAPTTTTQPTSIAPVALGARASLRCRKRYLDSRITRLWCRATGSGATRVSIRIRNVRRRTVARGTGEPGRYTRMRIGRLRRGRYTAVITFIAADGRRAVVTRRIRL